MYLTDRQNEIYQFIKHFFNEKGFAPTIREIADAFHFSPKAAHDHVKKLKDKKKLTFTSGLSRSIVLYDENEPIEEPTVEIPILGAIAAGVPIFSEENWEGKVAIAKALLSAKGKIQNQSFFALHVDGDSMVDAGILDGDLVVLVQQDWADNGMIVAAKTSEGGVTLKRFFKEQNRFRLQPENKNYQPIYTNDVHVLGRLKLVVRSY